MRMRAPPPADRRSRRWGLRRTRAEPFEESAFPFRRRDGGRGFWVFSRAASFSEIRASNSGGNPGPSSTISIIFTFRFPFAAHHVPRRPRGCPELKQFSMKGRRISRGTTTSRRAPEMSMTYSRLSPISRAWRPGSSPHSPPLSECGGRCLAGRDVAEHVDQVPDQGPAWPPASLPPP